jgi:hypothetical protein
LETGRAIGGAALFFALSAIVGYELGDDYIDRMSAREGFDLIPVRDTAKDIERPRHTVFVLIDGLRLDSAERTTFAAKLESRGQCFTTYVGLPSVSAPVYAVVSTGVEQDRTGVRNNDDHAPVRAESIWEVAREKGLRVVGRSELAWWREMFPRGFDELVLVEGDVDPLAVDTLPDLALLHPAYVDDAGHDHGAASAQYRDAVARADRGMNALLEKLDLSLDLIVVTADHGHSDSGGHGGAAPEITDVLTCYAGRGIVHRDRRGHMDSKSIAPSLAFLLGLRFPQDMRAIDDDLDSIFSLTSSASYSADYVSDRKEAVQRFRTENLRELGAWLGRAGGTWKQWYAHERMLQALRGALALILGSLALSLILRGMRPKSSVVDLVVWLLAVFAATYLLHRLLLGGFDFTCINKRAQYVNKEAMVCIAAGLFGFGAHRLLWNDPSRLLRDQTALVFAALTVEGAHIAAYGWPLGFPLPSAALYFLPFILSIFVITSSMLGLISALFAFLAKRRSEKGRLRPV